MEPTVRTDRTIRNNKPDITFRENKNGTCMLIDDVISGDKCDPARSREYTAHVECKCKSDTGNNRGDWNHLKISKTIPEQHTGKARN
jgi:hypothetical protein